MTEYPRDHVKIVIVDDCSIDKSLEIAEDFKRRHGHLFHSVEVIKLGQRVTTSKARNEGAKRAIPRSHLMFLDSDVILKPATLKNLLILAESDPKVGAVGALYLTPSPSLFEKLMWYRHLGKVSEGSAGTGALLVTSEVFKKVGPFNENLGYPKTVYEDLEYVMRIRRSGYRVLIDGRDPLLHLKVSQGEDQKKREKCASLKEGLRLYGSYFSLTKAYALHEALKVAPLKYKLEYVAYALLPFTIILLGLFSPMLFILTLFMLASFSLLSSFILYRKVKDITLKIIAGPAILLSRVSRALTLTSYIIAKRCLSLWRF
jgi:GT2 family glycosyltransferase